MQRWAKQPVSYTEDWTLMITTSIKWKSPGSNTTHCLSSNNLHSLENQLPMEQRKFTFDNEMTWSLQMKLTKPKKMIVFKLQVSTPESKAVMIAQKSNAQRRTLEYFSGQLASWQQCYGWLWGRERLSWKSTPPCGWHGRFNSNGLHPMQSM